MARARARATVRARVRVRGHGGECPEQRSHVDGGDVSGGGRAVSACGLQLGPVHSKPGVLIPG